MCFECFVKVNNFLFDCHEYQIIAGISYTDNGMATPGPLRSLLSTLHGAF